MNKFIEVLGDFNCNVLKKSLESRVLFNFLCEINLKQIIIILIRIIDIGEFLIDVILVLFFDFVYVCGVLNIFISDYLFVYMELQLKFFKFLLCYFLIRSYKYYNFDLFIVDLVVKCDKFFLIFLEEDINYKFVMFNDIFFFILDVYVLIKLIRICICFCFYVIIEIEVQMIFRDQFFYCY